MRVVFIGCVKFSASALCKLLALKNSATDVVGVVTRAQSPFNSDYAALEPIAKKNAIPCLFADRVGTLEMVRWIRFLAPDVIYCFGWSRLLGPEILSIPPLGVIGYHPAPLPMNRGRHPIIWTLALGLARTASTFFFMDQGADSGDILSQRLVRVSPKDNAASLYRKLTSVAMAQIQSFTAQLVRGRYKRIRQDSRHVNYWRKRSELDGKIDWRMSAMAIYNLIRALSRPYPGAFCEIGGRRVRIFRAVFCASANKNLEPGKVIGARAKAFTVKCGKDAITVLDHEFHKLPKRGDYL